MKRSGMRIRSNLIFLKEPLGPFDMIPREPAESDPAYVKHVSCEGAGFHVLSWDTNGRHCSERDCIVNKEVRHP